MSPRTSADIEQEMMALRQAVRRLEEENTLLRSIADGTEQGQIMQRRKLELDLIKDVGAAVLAELDSQRVLDLVAEMARQLIDADMVIVPLINAESSGYTYAAAAGKYADEVRGASHGLHVGMCGWVLTHQRSLLFGRADDWWMDDKTRWEAGMESALLVPLIARQRIIGGLSALGKSGGGSFTEHDLDLLTLFANQVSHAIDNARLFEEINQLVATLEQRVAERTLEMMALNKELEAFAYSVSHDLRAPLRSIDGFSLALLEDYGSLLAPEAQDYIARIRASTGRMGRLIDDLLALSRLSRAELHHQPIDLSAMARRIADELQAHEPERRVEFRIDEHLCVVGDAVLINSLMENLLGNSWKYSSKHPTALIEVGMLEQRGTPSAESADAATYFVRDDGAGFDMRYAPKLFGAFQRLHTAHEFPGTGIGLASVQRIINRHGGRIWAQGEVEKGATFFFSLPAKPAESAASEAPLASLVCQVGKPIGNSAS